MFVYHPNKSEMDMQLFLNSGLLNIFYKRTLQYSRSTALSV